MNPVLHNSNNSFLNSVLSSVNNDPMVARQKVLSIIDGMTPKQRESLKSALPFLNNIFNKNNIKDDGVLNEISAHL